MQSRSLILMNVLAWCVLAHAPKPSHGQNPIRTLRRLPEISQVRRTEALPGRDASEGELLAIGVELPVPHETLADAWEIAARTSPRLQIKVHHRDAAEHQWRAEVARRYPHLAVEGGYRASTDDLAIRFSPAMPGSPLGNALIPIAQEEGATARASVDWSIFDRQIAFLIEAAKDSEHAATYEKVIAFQDLKLSVAQSYFHVLIARHERETASNCFVNRKEYARNFAGNTRASNQQKLAVDTVVEKYRLEEDRAIQHLQLMESEYNLLLGRPTDFPFHVKDVNGLKVPEHAIENLVQRALYNRLELQQLSFEHQAALKNASAIAAGRLPQAKLIGDFNFNENRFVTPDGVGNLALVVSWNIFDGGRKHNQSEAVVRKARALRSLADELELQIRQEIHRLHHALKSGETDLRSIEADLRLAKNAIDEANVLQKRDPGWNQTLDLLDRQLEQSKLQLVLKKTRYEQAWRVFQLRRALGEI